jgi:DNA polymerase elongation subunit (family B)
MRMYTNVEVRGNSILYRGYENSKPIKRTIPYKPTLYVPSTNASDFTTIYGEKLGSVQFEDMRTARNYIREFKDVANMTIYGMDNFEYCFIAENFSQDIEWSISDLRVMSLDIEVSSKDGYQNMETADKEVIAITMKTGKNIIALGLKPFKTDVQYHHCKDEVELLRKFLTIWSTNYPDIVTGWNIRFYDIPYLVRRISRVLGDSYAELLSPWKNIDQRSVEMQGKTQPVYLLKGIAILDYIELYRKFAPAGKSQESYKLDNIAFVELGERKVSYQEEYGTLNTFYEQNPQLFMEYNVQDVVLIDKLEDKLKLIELAVALAYDNKCNFEDVFSQVRMWEVIIFNYLYKHKIALPPKSENSKHEQYVGAYVKDPLVGMHRWVVSVDLTSMYPHIIMQLNLSPETLVKPEAYTAALRKFVSETSISVDALLSKSIDTSILKSENVALSPNAQFFRRGQQGFLAYLMENMYTSRDHYKKMMTDAKKQKIATKDKQYDKLVSKYNNLQLAKKVSLNSAYGACGNEYFRFFDVRLAAAITTTGQLAIRWIQDKINKRLNQIMKTTDVDYVIASDTDSVYITLEKMVEQVSKDKVLTTEETINFMDRFVEKSLQPYIDECYKELAEYLNCETNRMHMKREALADVGIWTGKKRYILSVWDNERVRYTEPDIKIMGSEAVRSSTPTVCRDKIKEAIRIFLYGKEPDIWKFVSNFREEFHKMPASSVAFPRGVTEIKKWTDPKTLYAKSTPIHVKGSLFHNRFLKENNITHIQPIREGEKIKFVYLKKPNPFYCEVISFVDSLPKEFGLDNYIDYEVQYEKSFLSPLQIIADAIGWNLKRKASLF